MRSSAGVFPDRVDLRGATGHFADPDLDGEVPSGGRAEAGRTRWPPARVALRRAAPAAVAVAGRKGDRRPAAGNGAAERRGEAAGPGLARAVPGSPGVRLAAPAPAPPRAGPARPPPAPRPARPSRRPRPSTDAPQRPNESAPGRSDGARGADIPTTTPPSRASTAFPRRGRACRRARGSGRRDAAPRPPPGRVGPRWWSRARPRRDGPRPSPSRACGAPRPRA